MTNRMTLERWASFLSLLLLLGSVPGYAWMPAGDPIRLTIDDAYRLARQQYPLSRQRALLQRSLAYSVDNASKGYLPQLNVSGQATYQSTVTSLPVKIPITGFSLPAYSKDQYRIYGEIDQVVYDGGQIRHQQQAARVDEQVQEASLDVDLYALYDRINQLYFGILLIVEELRQNQILQDELGDDINNTIALIRNGITYSSSLDELKAQLLQAHQARTELKALRKAYLDILSQFTGLALDESSFLVTPPDPMLTDSIQRPELQLFASQKRSYDLQDQLADDQWKPRFSLFFQGGAGRPGLDMLSNDFSWYYIGGLRLTWNLGSLYTLKNQKRMTALGRRGLDVREATFLFNTYASQRQYNAEISKGLALLADDQLIVSLRANVRKAARAQMENGTLSAHDYISQVTAEDQAVQTGILHKVQLLQAEYNYRNLSGNLLTAASNP